MAKGFSQREGINFEEVFAPMARTKTIRLVIGIKNNNNWSIYQLNVKYAFLKRPLDEEVYVEQSPRFTVKNQEFKFYKLNKELYKLKQALRAWNRRIDGFLKEIGFKKCVSEQGVYVKTDISEGVITLCIYVDDFLITGSGEKCISKFKCELMKEFEMMDLGSLIYFLSMEFHKSKRELLMHQGRYALEKLKKCEIEHYNATITQP